MTYCLASKVPALIESRWTSAIEVLIDNPQLGDMHRTYDLGCCAEIVADVGSGLSAVDVVNVLQ